MGLGNLVPPPAMSDLFIRRGATFSPCERYRYRLWRYWDFTRPALVLVMCNPSTATAEYNDPTVERVQRRAVHLQCGGLEVVNIFALRSTDPRALYQTPDPVGPANDEHILAAASRPDALVVCAWGAHGAHLSRGAAVERILRANGIRLHALAFTKGGAPGHPLYLPYELQPREWA